MGLAEYVRKRNFDQTPEPETGKGTKSGPLRFVVQRHQASKLHYDFRLEMDGVLKSWAVPKGPSLYSGEKRLAVMVEDHPYDYRTFEGDIPEGNYGAGHVDIWDEGTYTAVDPKGRSEGERRLLQGLEKGHLKFVMHGHKLEGEFALVRMHGREKNAWLLIKHDDDFATDVPYDSEDHLEPVTGTGKKARGSRRRPRRSDARGDEEAHRGPKAARKERDDAAPEEVDAGAPVVDAVEPMLATLYAAPFDDPDWLFEIKFDGYRAIARVDRGRVELISRNGKPFHERYVPIVRELEALKIEATLDGEVVVLDSGGISHFQLLQRYLEQPSDALIYYVFDLLELNGQDLRERPLLERKRMLRELVPEGPHVRYSDHVMEHGVAFFEAAVKQGLEGIVAKQARSPYREGVRGDEWLKIKVSQRQEAIICGYTAPRGSRKHFGALILGLYEGGRLVHAGNCGSGFDSRQLASLYRTFQRYVQEDLPFEVAPKAPAAITWMRPALVCEVAFGGWTEDGLMRHPIFQGLRTDKPAGEVSRELPEVGDRPGSAPGGRKRGGSSPAKRGAGSDPSEKNASRRSGWGGHARRAREDREDAENEVRLNGHRVALTHPDKVYWPDEGYTKGDVIAYYAELAPLILPYLKGRPESLHRHPNGILEKGFFQKDLPDSAPDWIETAEIFSASTGRDVRYLVCQNEATLTYMNNLGCIEIHPWHSRVGALDFPDYAVIDLDPGHNTFDQVIEVALAVKEVLERAKVPAFAKTSGATGLHIYVPMGARYTADQTTDFVHLVVQLVHEQLPKLTSLERSPAARRKLIYLDYLQNHTGQTLAAVYSLRPRPGAPVSTPLRWTELKPGLTPLDFTIRTIGKRIKRVGDLFEGVLGEGVDMLAALKRLGG